MISDLDILSKIFNYLDINCKIIFIKINRYIYSSKNTLFNYNSLKFSIIKINKYNNFLIKLINHNKITINNCINLINNKIYNKYLYILLNLHRINNINHKLLLIYVYKLLNIILNFILNNYTSNHIIFYDIYKYKEKKNIYKHNIELVIDYNNTYKNYIKFNLLNTYLSIYKYYL